MPAPSERAFRVAAAEFGRAQEHINGAFGGALNLRHAGKHSAGQREKRARMASVGRAPEPFLRFAGAPGRIEPRSKVILRVGVAAFCAPRQVISVRDLIGHMTNLAAIAPPDTPGAALRRQYV